VLDLGPPRGSRVDAQSGATRGSRRHDARRARRPPRHCPPSLVAGTRAPQALRDEPAVLRPMGLRLSAAKTAIRHIDEGFDFLGFRIVRQFKRGTGQRIVYTYPPRSP
jgi:hypothetical protein